MRGRRVGALVTYNRALRKIRRARAKGIATPSHLASGKPVPLQNNVGEWHAWAPPVPGPPFVPAKPIAGPFDTREEAQEWIDDQ